MDRVDLLLDYLRSNNSEKDLGQYIDQLMTNSDELAANIESDYVNDLSDWYDSITHKRVYSTMKSIVAGTEVSESVVMKAITSLLTQLFIRLEKNPKFPVKLFNITKLVDIVNTYVNMNLINMDEVKSVLSEVLSRINKIPQLSLERSEVDGILE